MSVKYNFSFQMKIKFVSNGPIGEVNALNYSETNINPAYFFIKAYYMLHGQNPEVEWLPCDFTMFDSVNVQANQIIQQAPDLLALSVYVWNETHQFQLAQQVKQALPNITVVMGGPQLTAHKNPNFFEQYPFVDFVCYGDGERAFQLLIDRLSGHVPRDVGLVNMVENLQPGHQVWPFEMLQDPEYLSTSVYTIQKQDVIDSVDQLVARGVPRNKLVFATEFARGCMYKCSFCDWSQNLTKKVKRKTFDWKQELDFFKELDIVVRETDANFGQWDEDYEIFDYGISLYDPAKNYKFRVHNTAKLKKRATYHFGLTQAKVYGFRVHVSLQDINDHVLKNIDRPSISWNDHIELIQQIQADLPNDKKHLLGVQLINGLPGQTYRSIVDMQLHLYKIGVRQGAQNVWVYLDNSPAADPMYQKLHKLEWIDTFFLTVDSIKVTDLDALYTDLKNGIVDPKMWVRLKIVKQNKTLSFPDMIKAQLFRQYFSRYVRTADGLNMTEEKLLETEQAMSQRVHKEIDDTLKVLTPYIEKHNIFTFCVLQGNSLRRIDAD
jgi:hypothetical protein